MDVACTKLFLMSGPKEYGKEWVSTLSRDFLAALKEDFDTEDYLERMQFPPLHKIILGILEADLETQLKLSTSEIDSLDYQGRTALAWAAIRADERSLKTLLKYGANSNVKAFNGDTALHYAVRARKPCCVRPLIEHGADVNARNVWRVNPMCYTMTYRDDIDYLTPLIEAKADLELADKHGRTALVRAVNLDRLSLVECLLQNGARCTIDDLWGNKPLMTAIHNRSTSIYQTLIQYTRGSLNRAQLTNMICAAKASDSLDIIQDLERTLARLVD